MQLISLKNHEIIVVVISLSDKVMYSVFESFEDEDSAA